jgi:sRNA-binding carbon storage regulator CsrA
MSGLILSRRKGEKILIHDNGEVLVTLTVLDSNEKVSVIRIESDPDEFDVDRLEIFNSKYGD